MSINQSTILLIARRCTAFFLLAASAISAFAILGDKGRTPRNHSFLSNQHLTINTASFSLKSNYNFRGSQIINTARSSEYIDLNTTITYQKGNTTYIVPLKKKIFITTSNAGFTINH
ncbi:MAG: hypothetical protein E6H06_07610 [Bacteroidetes bacterium]|nr:MAG: hypothetical protein E6H06_07610 [Bacteroidota bacterium]